jgi:GWxTD domain-containing protein
MIIRCSVIRGALPLLALLLGASATVRAEKLSKEDGQWLAEVRVPILPDEERIFRSLNREDRLEFRKIFWARRNPNGPAAVANPFRAELDRSRAEAMRRFGGDGGASDCGRVFLLLGEPDEIRPANAGLDDETGFQAAGPERQLGPREGSTDPNRITLRTTWVYRQPKGVRLKSGALSMSFDAACRATDGSRHAIDALLAPAIRESWLVNPWIEVRLDASKRLVPLERLLPQAGPAQALLASPREDFPLADEVIFMKPRSGGTAILGALRGRLEGTPAGASVKVTVRAETMTAQGDVVASTERDTAVRPVTDGSFMVAYGLASRPGAFTLRAGVVEVGGPRGAAITHAIEVPDFGAPGLSHSTLALLESVEPVEKPSAEDPLAPFVMGQHRFVPRVGRAFSRGETMAVFCHTYGAEVDATTGKAAIVGSLGAFRNKTSQFNRTEQRLDVADGALVYGPIPIEAFAPGAYEAELRITDQVSKQEVVVQRGFEVLP